MWKWYKYRILFLLALALLSTSIGFASAATDVFEEFAEDSHYIASRGNVPDTIDQEWKNALRDCWLNIIKKVGPSYSEFDSSINNIGVGNNILNVYVGSAYKGQINDSRIDEMYQNIGSYCEENCGINDVPVVFLWDEDEEDMALPDYGYEMFEKAANSSEFVAARGTMPIITDATEKRDWTDLLVHCSRANDKIDNYFVSSGGPVSSFGTYIDGYLKVGLDSATPERVNDSVIDEIYKTIDEAAQEEGVNDVPAVFMWEHEEEIDLETDDSTSDSGLVTIKDENGTYIDVDKDAVYIDENGKYALKDNSTIDESSESNTHTTPGFTSIMLILCMSIISRFTKTEKD
ncbi:hypothetical protein [Methanolobus profundi]|uniref:Uncharacterized protein n=1 Tax=Methanolobus profundi TaxID=487685 RepID=A0A1I4TNR3_9EURY|nr:hypothetical protein [Methanolobus profundi]SFM78438.1 hypothetical protein SAMN04488696_2371 [Methanolobus profundi]